MLVVNRIILDLVCKLLELPDFRSIVPGMHPPDVELLLDFILYVRNPFSPLARFGFSLTPDSYSKMTTCRLAACKTPIERPGD